MPEALFSSQTSPTSLGFDCRETPLLSMQVLKKIAGIGMAPHPQELTSNNDSSFGEIFFLIIERLTFIIFTIQYYDIQDALRNIR